MKRPRVGGDKGMGGREGGGWRWINGEEWRGEGRAAAGCRTLEMDRVERQEMEREGGGSFPNRLSRGSTENPHSAQC
jgi:hypothetical protein